MITAKEPIGKDGGQISAAGCLNSQELAWRGAGQGEDEGAPQPPRLRGKGGLAAADLQLLQQAIDRSASPREVVTPIREELRNIADRNGATLIDAAAWVSAHAPAAVPTLSYMTHSPNSAMSRVNNLPFHL